MRVLDLGGEVDTWRGLEPRPREVTLLNIPWVADAQAAALATEPDLGWIRVVAGDACDPPDSLVNEPFDLIYSNSVIEHVGGHHRRREFAATVMSLGTHYWIQTPNRYFLLEPHWLFPGIQFLPPRAAAAVTRRWKVGHLANSRQPLADVLEVELLSATELRFYFPDSEIVRERVAGMTKSLIAVR